MEAIDVSDLGNIIPNAPAEEIAAGTHGSLAMMLQALADTLHGGGHHNSYHSCGCYHAARAVVSTTQKAGYQIVPAELTEGRDDE